MDSRYEIMFHCRGLISDSNSTEVLRTHVTEGP
jgi:hypothetical protein